MSDKTAIGWTDATWNPVTGCSKVSPGCEHCYAEALSHRYGWTTQPWTMPHASDNVQMHPDRLDQPLRWRKPRKIFVNSMSDLFHPAVPDAFLCAVFGAMAAAPQHTFQVLTKRPDRMRDWFGHLERRTAQASAVFPDDPEGWRRRQVLRAALIRQTGADTPPIPEETPWPLPNVWLGVSVEDQRRAQERIPLLLQTPAALRFLSCEPLLGPLDLTDFQPFAIGCPETGIDWVIVGAESGPQARPMDEDWVQSLRDQCQDADVPFFFKQRATDKGHKLVAPLLDGQRWQEFPAVPTI